MDGVWVSRRLQLISEQLAKMENGRTAKWRDVIISLLLAITSRLLFSIAICCDVTPIAICHVGQSF